MKSITIEYLSGLGDYLDENDIKWESLADGRVKIFYDTPEQLFFIGIDFGKK